MFQDPQASRSVLIDRRRKLTGVVTPSWRSAHTEQGLVPFHVDNHGPTPIAVVPSADGALYDLEVHVMHRALCAWLEVSWSTSRIPQAFVRAARLIWI